MYCTNCGKEINDGMKFCTECGAPVQSAAAPAAPAPAVQPAPAQTPIPAAQPEYSQQDLNSQLHQAYSDHAAAKAKTRTGIIFLVIAAVLFTFVGIFSAVIEANAYYYVVRGSSTAMLVIDFIALIAAIALLIPGLINLIKGITRRNLANQRINAIKARQNRG